MTDDQGTDIDEGTPDIGRDMGFDGGMPVICEECRDTSFCPEDHECQVIDDNSGQKVCLPTCGRDEFDICPAGWACVGPTGAGVCFPARGCCTVATVGLACEGEGECGAGVLECDENGGSRCSTEPGGTADESIAELCNGLDDDCDGEVDEAFLVGDPCDGRGACGAGTVQCNPNDATQMTTLCSTEPGGTQNQAAANDLLCNGIDDDCDGQTDEDRGVGDICDGAGACGQGELECATINTTRCSTDPGGSAHNPGGADVCDGADNDCDTRVDETFPTLGTVCAGVGVCGAGLIECNGVAATRCSTHPGGSQFTGAANDNTCNGMDDDCDTRTDEDLGIGQPCDPPGPCGQGVFECNGAQLPVCNTGPGGTQSQAQPETCNNMNDDCDMATDEGFNIGGNCDGPGECGNGQFECNLANGTARCSTAPGGSAYVMVAETCDGLDQDCNGTADNGSVSMICPATSSPATVVCNGASGCAITGCPPNTFNGNGVYADGCECVDTEAASDNACANGANDFNPGIGATQTRDGVIYGAADSDWYQAVIPAGLNSGIRIELTGNPGNALRFDVNQGGCSTAPDCSGPVGFQGLTLSTRHNCAANLRPGDPASSIYNACNNTQARTYYIRVYRAQGTSSCISYTLSVRAGEANP